MKNFELSILIGAVDRYSKPAKKVAESSKKVAARITESQKAMRALGEEGKAIVKMRSLEERLSKTASEFSKNSQKVAELGRELAATEKPSRKLERQFERSRKAANALRDKHRQQREELRHMRTELRGAGVDTRNLAAAQDAVARKLEEGTRKMKKMAQVSEELTKSRKRMDRTLQRAAGASLVAGGMARAGDAATGLISDPIERMRGIERSRGELASLGVKDLDAITNAGMDATRNLAGMDTASFISAAYDIKSGISSLDDKGVAAMTSNAAWTAKATKGDVGQMTSLFATAYGSFKDNLYKGASDEEFGDIFSASLSKSVEQFKTDGSKMQQAIQSMGSGLAASGVSLSNQMTAIGMLQQKMEAGVAGTAVAALGRTAADAQKRFEEMGIDFKTLDEKGNLRDLPELLEQAKEVFGDEYTTEIGSKMKKAFGSDEAMRFFEALWGQEKAFRANRLEVERAQAQGSAFTHQMAKDVDNNMDARMAIQEQKWNLIKARMGAALIPALERLMPMMDKVTGWVEGFVANHSSVSTALVAVVGGVGLIATVAAPVVTAIAAVTTALATLGYKAKKAHAEMTMEGFGDDDGDGGKRRNRRKRKRDRGKSKGLRGFDKIRLAGTKGSPGKFGKALRLSKGAGRRIGGVGAVIGGLSMVSNLLDSKASAGEKAAAVTRDVGGIAGGAGGATAGAALGTLILPGVGTAIGGLIGGIAGGAGGDWLGGLLGGLFTSDRGDGEGKKTMIANAKAKAAAVAGAGVMMAAPAMAGVPDLGNIPTLTPQHSGPQIGQIKKEYNLNIQQLPGEDADALVEKIMAELKRREDEERQGALYDID